MEKRFLQDLAGVSDKVEYVPNWDTLHKQITEDYDYIVICGELEKRNNYLNDLEKLYKRLKTGGIMVFQTFLKQQAETVLNKYTTTGVIIEDIEYPLLQKRD